jgi:hypothetical protein
VPGQAARTVAAADKLSMRYEGGGLEIAAKTLKQSR